MFILFCKVVDAVVVVVVVVVVVLSRRFDKQLW